MDKILQIVHQHGLLSQVQIAQNIINVCDKNLDSDITIHNIQRYVISIPKTVPQEKVVQLSATLEKLQLNLEISHKFGVNQKMPHFKDLHQVFSEQTAQLQHKPGEVILVDVWATWCGPCQRPMQHNQEMLEKNSDKWKDKVRIVAVSVDEDKESLKQRITAKGWTKIEHLTLLGWKNDHPLISNFQIQGIPFVFLVNKEGKINFVGHPSQINLQQRINQLIQNQVEIKEKNQEEIKDISQAVSDEIKHKQEIKKLLKKQLLEQKFGKGQIFQSFSKILTKINRGKVQKTPSKFKVSAYEDNGELVKEFRQFFKDIDQAQIEIEENLVKFTNVPDTSNASCADCKTVLAFPFYWCRWDEDPNTFRCRECVQKPSQQEGLHYSYNKNSVLLGGPWKRIALKGLGKNIQPLKQEISNLDPHQFGCNGHCQEGPQKNGQARYIALGVRNDPNLRGDYIDLCSKCFKRYLEGNEEVKKALLNDGHKENHPMLRILYNVKGYYQF